MRRGRYRRRRLPVIGLIAAAGLMALLAASFLVHRWGIELRVAAVIGWLVLGTCMVVLEARTRWRSSRPQIITPYRKRGLCGRETSLTRSLRISPNSLPNFYSSGW